MSFWNNVKKDIQKGFKEGMAFVKEGATVVMEKAEELTEEGKKRYNIFELKTKVQKEITELGGKVYDLSSKRKNPLLDSKVKANISRIKKLELKINRLEGKSKKASATKPRKRVSPSKGRKKLPAK
jgi:hypothetical protein